MCSEQIRSLAQSVADVTSDITELRYLLDIAEVADPAANSQKFVQVAEDFNSRFSVLDTDRFQDRKYSRDWFMTWDTMRISATKELMNAAKSLDDNPAQVFIPFFLRVLQAKQAARRMTTHDNQSFRLFFVFTATHLFRLSIMA
ncbi:hypothetical protein Pst134EA_008982 [Puccinia striiformis f. sp. tritici]|uniref:Uncharacterized protein n=1 Tax=Puccinia striiformis TaxID=27350 RepID=A0A2S4UV74_9BASI|nr:hypothetical protein Pst134EA_008982 [Puccinia striiformis f. sp. tritici]KAH9468438.1 hypothetical protein Pst134EA_008982 [Puccinia striiformis f. sp. tritici]KAI9609612.1 hypothetical protein H4Q26_007572 [Puccinia striiformis f. sp. tritici PST-130]POW01189.1 hypothetical protein PSHT_12663 [Puccinia striiformis]